VGNGLFLTVQTLSNRVEWLCTSWQLPPVSRHICQRYRVILLGIKRTAASISKATVLQMGMTIDCCTTAFFFCRRAADSCFSTFYLKQVGYNYGN